VNLLYDRSESIKKTNSLTVFFFSASITTFTQLVNHKNKISHLLDDMV